MTKHQSNSPRNSKNNLKPFKPRGPAPFNTLGLFTFLRTYARRHDETDPNSTIESWEECITRLVLACNNQLKVNFTENELDELFHLLYNLKCSMAGRFMWQLGTSNIDKTGILSLQNCFSQDTKFWTPRGAKAFSEFQDGDGVMVKGRYKWMPAIVKSFGTQQLYKLSYNKKGNIQHIYTTPNHRWIVISKDLREHVLNTIELCSTDKLICEDNEIYNVIDVKPTERFETVWCVSEPVYEEFTLEDGIVTKNCAFARIDSPIEPFTWAMNLLMLGAGVGYSVLPKDLEQLPEVKYALITRKDAKDADFIVPDSRQGWIKLLGRVLKAHFYSGKSFTYSCTLLRSKGAPIKGFGGLASGPDVLCDGMAKINTILNQKVGQKIKSTDALDIMNIIGMIVVSGKMLATVV